MGKGVGTLSFLDLLMTGKWRMWIGFYKFCIEKIRPFMEDQILFKGSRNDAFSVKIMYRVLDCSPQVVFPSRSIWNPVIPPRIGFFAWEASWGKVLTLDQLKRQGRALANRCFLGEEYEEDINRLLVHCKKARMLWDLLLSIVGTC